MKYPPRRAASCGCGYLAALVTLIVVASLQIQHHHLKVDLGRADFATATATQTQRRRPETSRWSRKTGAEGLPRGIVETHSDMYLRPLWDSAAATKTSAKNKNEKYKALLAMAVGISQMQNVDTMARKFLNESYTVMLFHYDGNVDGWRGLEWSDKAIHILAPNQTKWWFAKRFLHPSVVAIYDFIFLWDEDLGVEKFDPRSDVMEEFHKEMRALGQKVLDMFYKALGIGDDQMAGGEVERKIRDTMTANMHMNMYPKCPEPERAIGLAAHADSSIFHPQRSYELSQDVQKMEPGATLSNHMPNVVFKEFYAKADA